MRHTIETSKHTGFIAQGLGETRLRLHYVISKGHEIAQRYIR